MNYPVRVRFRGGPLGGEERIYERSGLYPRLRVMSLPEPFNFSEMESAAVPTVSVRVEEYDIRPGANRDEYEARWVYPEKRLLRENEALKARIMELELGADAIAALEVLRGYFSRN